MRNTVLQFLLNVKMIVSFCVLLGNVIQYIVFPIVKLASKSSFLRRLSWPHQHYSQSDFCIITRLTQLRQIIVEKLVQECNAGK